MDCRPGVSSGETGGSGGLFFEGGRRHQSAEGFTVEGDGAVLEGVESVVVSGDGPARDYWFGKDGEELPSEIIIGRMPPEGAAAVTITSKTVPS